MRIEAQPVWKRIAVYLGVIAVGYFLFPAVWGGVGGLLVGSRLASDSAVQAELEGMLRGGEETARENLSPEKRETLETLIKQRFKNVSWWRIHLLANAITFATLGALAGLFGLVRYSVVIPLALLPLTARVLAADEFAAGSRALTILLGLSAQLVAVYPAAGTARWVRTRVSTKALFIGGAIVAVLLVVAITAIGLTSWFMRSTFSPLMPSRTSTPVELSTPGVLTGHEVLRRVPYLQEARLGWITAIRVRPAHKNGLLVAGTGGAGFVRPDGGLERMVPFSGCIARADALDADDDHGVTFMNRGAWACPASLLAHDGMTLWTYGGWPGVDDMAAGDLDGTGLVDFVVGFNGDGGIHRVGSDGRRKWRQADRNVWHVEVVDTDGDGRREIVHTNAAGEMVIRDATGQVIRRVRPPVYVAHFSITPWPRRGGRLHALHSAKETLRIIDFAGRVVVTMAAPRLSDPLDAHAVLVRLEPGQSEYFAVLAEYRPWKRSVLYVYAPDGALRYQEILPEACASLAALPTTGLDSEALLIGCQGTVWRYQFG